jgi:hypothetical protein
VARWWRRRSLRARLTLITSAGLALALGAGALLLVIVLFFPSGLMGWVYSRFPRVQRVLE